MNEQWELIKDLLLGHQGHVGVTAPDNRLFVEAVLYSYGASIASMSGLRRMRTTNGS